MPSQSDQEERDLVSNAPDPWAVLFAVLLVICAVIAAILTAPLF